MRKLIHRALRAAQKFTVWDYACFKLSLVSLGILLGAYFANFFLQHALLLWIIFLVSYLLLLFSVVIK